MSVQVSIDPSFGDENMEGEYDDNRFMEADNALVSAVQGFVAAGGRSDNLEHAIEVALEDIIG